MLRLIPFFLLLPTVLSSPIVGPQPQPDPFKYTGPVEYLPHDRRASRQITFITDSEPAAEETRSPDETHSPDDTTPSETHSPDDIVMPPTESHSPEDMTSSETHSPDNTVMPPTESHSPDDDDDDDDDVMTPMKSHSPDDITPIESHSPEDMEPETDPSPVPRNVPLDFISPKTTPTETPEVETTHDDMTTKPMPSEMPMETDMPITKPMESEMPIPMASEMHDSMDMTPMPSEMHDMPAMSATPDMLTEEPEPTSDIDLPSPSPDTVTAGETPDMSESIEPSPEGSEICVDASYLSHVAQHELVHKQHIFQHVYCPQSNTLPCATADHMLRIDGNQILSYKQFCDNVDITCEQKKMYVNSVLTHLWKEHEEKHHVVGERKVTLTMMDVRHPEGLQLLLHRFIALKRSVFGF